MGLWPWTINQMLGPKFFKHVKKEGLLRTYIRGHQAIKNDHDLTGRLGSVKCVGQDQFGNKYYEDFDVELSNSRRWVEMSDYFLPLGGIKGDRVPSPWHGWLSRQYDDLPSEGGFVKHHYMKEHTENLSDDPRHHKPLGSPQNMDRLEFIESTHRRKTNPWATPDAGAKTIGKKIVVERTMLIEDPAQSM
mmetsp:Transcript_26628/g.23596  ORF Transcript_26628/g.23596 Transcript_26628/m.23596 type:complete len:190 (+) Transcript_26628:49-618(+)